MVRGRSSRWPSPLIVTHEEFTQQISVFASIGLDTDNLKGPILIPNSCLWEKMRRKIELKHSRGLQHDTAHARHGAEAVRGVLYGQGLILREGERHEHKQQQRQMPLLSRGNATRGR